MHVTNTVDLGCIVCRCYLATKNPVYRSSTECAIISSLSTWVIDLIQSRSWHQNAFAIIRKINRRIQGFLSSNEWDNHMYDMRGSPFWQNRLFSGNPKPQEVKTKWNVLRARAPISTHIPNAHTAILHIWLAHNHAHNLFIPCLQTVVLVG